MDSLKAPGSDSIPADLLRQSKYCLLRLLHDILVKYGREGKVPQNMCDAKGINLYKNKGANQIVMNTRKFPCLVLLAKFLHV